MIGCFGIMYRLFGFFYGLLVFLRYDIDISSLKMVSWNPKNCQWIIPLKTVDKKGESVCIKNG